jgi:cob(I)alamin adenosyltransferase
VPARHHIFTEQWAPENRRKILGMLDEVKSCINAEYAHLVKRLQGGQAHLFQEDLFQLGATRAILTSSSDMLAR